MNHEPNAAAENPAGTAAPAKKRKKKRKLLRILLIVLAAVILLFVGGYTYWVIRGSSLVMPCGLKPGMSLEASHQALKDRGFRETDFSETLQEYTYAPYSLFDVAPAFVTMSDKGSRITLTFYFHDHETRTGQDAADGSDHPSPAFEHILSRLTAVYGSPQESVVNGRAHYGWSGIHMNFDFFSFTLAYFDEGSFAVTYSCTRGIL